MEIVKNHIEKMLGEVFHKKIFNVVLPHTISVSVSLKYISSKTNLYFEIL